MKRLFNTAVAIGTLFCLAAHCTAQVPEMPQPTPAHELLAQFAGEWNVTATMMPQPGIEPFTCEGTESAEMVGGFWLVGRGTSSMEGTPMASMLTIGYDPAAKNYVGTFCCSMDSTLWKYTGSMDESGKKLTLFTQGPCMLEPSKTVKYRETLELTDPEHKVFTSEVQVDDGTWKPIVTMEYQRKPSPTP